MVGLAETSNLESSLRGTAYGLTIGSNLQFSRPLWPAAPILAPPDVQLWVSRGSWSPDSGSKAQVLSASDFQLEKTLTFELRLPEGLKVSVAGCSVELELARSTPTEFAEQVFFNGVLAIQLEQRGLLALHGSAVSVEGRAMGFLGLSGAGKSTLAAAFLRDGHEWLGDDLMACGLDPHPRLRSSFPALRLSTTSIRGLWNREPERSWSTVVGGEKWLVPLQDVSGTVEPPRGDSPLGALLVLDPSAPSGVRELEGAEAVTKLVQHSFVPRILGVLGLTATRFERLAKLVAETRVFECSLSRDFRRLQDEVRMLTGLFGDS